MAGADGVACLAGRQLDCGDVAVTRHLRQRQAQPATLGGAVCVNVHLRGIYGEDLGRVRTGGGVGGRG